MKQRGGEIPRTSQVFQAAAIMKSFLVSNLTIFYGRSGAKGHIGPEISVSVKNLWNLLPADETQGHR